MVTDEFEVVKEHIDVLGHLNYLELDHIAEDARLLFLEERGVGRETLLKEHDLGLLVREHSTKYLLEVFEGEKLQVSIDIERKGRLHLQFSLIVRRGPLPVARAEMSMVLVQMSDARRHALEIPDWLMEKLVGPPATTS